MLIEIAGVVQWQNGSFPSCIRGFDSLHPLTLPSRSGKCSAGFSSVQFEDVSEDGCLESGLMDSADSRRGVGAKITASVGHSKEV